MQRSFRVTRSAAIAALATLFLAVSATGCAVRGPTYYDTAVRPQPYRVVHGSGYPGVALVYDRAWGGYTVRGYPGYYFHAGHFYRWHGGVWNRAARFRGPWVRVGPGVVPWSLRSRFAPHGRPAVRERRRHGRR